MFGGAVVALLDFTEEENAKIERNSQGNVRMQENVSDVKIKAKVQVACSRQRRTSSCVERNSAYLGKNGVEQNYSHYFLSTLYPLVCIFKSLPSLIGLQNLIDFERIFIFFLFINV